VVLKDPEISVETDINARRLNQIGGIRLQPDPACIKLGFDVAVGEQHGATLPR
jgi:hypothetical protein